MIKGDRKPNCGICGTLKVERKNRLTCPKCARRYALEYYHSNPKKPLTDNQKTAKYKNRKKVRESGLTNQKVYAMKMRYGITELQYINLSKKQKGKCGVCSKPLTNDTLVDHNHLTGEVRGLLCRHCNFALGLFKDNITNLKQAIKYLRTIVRT